MVLNLWGKTAAALTTTKQLDRLRDAEQALIEIAYKNHHQQQQQQSKPGSNNTSHALHRLVHKEATAHIQRPNIQVFDTIIPIDSVLQRNTKKTGTTVLDDTTSYKIHGVSVTTTASESNMSGLPRSDKPLVLLHGYMNGGAYFYRNLIGLSQYYNTIYAIDQLGWGLSSRVPSFTKYYNDCISSSPTSSFVASKNDINISDSGPIYKSADKSNEADDNIATRIMVRIAESFFVESLEMWRKMMKIDSMILSGHSMGGYIAVAYCEKYPQHVHQLILISPVGVPIETPEMIEARKSRTTWRFRLFESIFSYMSLGDILRTLPESISKKWIKDYVIRRLPAITDPNEQEALAEYLYCNNGLLPGSGEYCLPKILKPSVFGHLPLVDRIPLLKVQSCSFFYGDNDWMDINGGLEVLDVCNHLNLGNMKTPIINVYQVSQAGHLLMLENSEEFNNGLILSSLLQEANCTSVSNIDVSSITASHIRWMDQAGKIPKKVVREDLNVDLQQQSLQ